MTESGTTETEQETSHTGTVTVFGETLLLEREKQNFTIADVAKNIHLAEDIIDAIERSDVERLPQPTFVQGYLRTYAKYLGLDPEPILETFAKAVPHSMESKLKPRTTVRSEANSGSPYVKTVSIALVVMMFLAVVYGFYSYYSDAVSNKNLEMAEDSDADAIALPDESTYLNEPGMDRGLTPDSYPDYDTEVQGEGELDTAFSDTQSALTENEAVAETEPVIETAVVSTSDDTIEFVAAEDSWVDVKDANGSKLFYNLLKRNRSIGLTGEAPFKVFLGNAPGMGVRVNGLPVDMTKYIRSNKIARFSVSTDDQQVVFH